MVVMEWITTNDRSLSRQKRCTEANIYGVVIKSSIAHRIFRSRS